MAELEAQIVDTGAALKKFNEEKNSKKSIEAEQHLKRLRKQYEEAKHGVESYRNALKSLDTKSIKELTRMKKALNDEIKKLPPNTEAYIQRTKEFKQVEGRIRSLEKAYKDTGTASRGWLKSLSDISGGLLIMGKGIKTAIALAGRLMEAYKTISNFEQANANLASILGATSDQMEKLEKAAVALGSSTRYSASQVTGLQTELAKLGFTVKEITDMSPAVLNFAGSVGTDLASAAALAGVALRSFNLGSEQTEDALGTMAVACNKSALSFTYLQNSFSTIAPVAKTYGLSLKDTIALLGTLANAGFDASSAATATRNILLNLSDTNGKLAKALGGSVHSFEDIMAAMKKLRDQGVDLNTTLELTDKRSVAAFNTFLDGAESAMELRGELEDVNGKLQEMAEQRANTVEGAIDGMKSAWEGLVLSFRNSSGTFKEVIDGIANGIRGLTLLMSRNSRVDSWAENMKDEVQAIYDQFGPEYFEMWVESRNKEFATLFQKAGGGRKQQNKGDEWMGFKQAVENVDKTPKDISLAKRLDQIERVYNAKVAQFEADVSLSKKDVDKKIAEARTQYEADRQAAIKAEAQKQEAIVKEKKNAGEKKKQLTEEELKKLEAANKKAYDKEKAQIDAAYNYFEKSDKAKWLQGEMGEAEYHIRVERSKSAHYQALLKLAKKYGQDDTTIRNKMLDDHIKALEAEKKRVKVEMEEMMKVYATEHPDQNMSDEDYKKLLDNQRRQGYKEKLGTIPGETYEEFDARIEQYEAFQEKMLAKAADIRAAITEDSARTEYETEVAWAEKLAEQKKITAEEAERYILQAKLKYAQAAAQQVSQITEQASNFVAALKEAESAQMEAEYQRQLTAAGDNAEERERIEAEHEQKKLDLQKKYADVEMAVNIAKTIANGAVAAIKAYADAGPVAGAILAALIAATTAAEVATIIAQRNAIKNASVSSSGSTSSAPKTGERKITGYAEGGYTGKGLGTMGVTERPARPPKRGPSTGSGTAGSGDEEVVGVVHANEWVAPAWMVRQNPVMFANLEQYRQRGYAEGGYTGKGLGTMGVTERPARPPKRGPSTGSGTAGSGDGGIETIVRVAVREELPSALKALRVVLVRRDLTELDAQTEKFEEQTSR